MSVQALSGRPDSGRKPTPPARVAMVGAGQLARMTHQAAISLGVELTVLAKAEDDPAVLAGASHLIGSPGDIDDLRRLAEGADVVTFDHEQIDPSDLETLEEEGVKLAPGAAAKLLAQDKLHARRTLSAMDFPNPPFATVSGIGELEQFAEVHGWPIVVKTPRGGYDGRGVWKVADRNEALRLLEEVPGDLLLEPLLDIERELAVMIARSPDGEKAAYPVVETVQRDAMCREVIAPANVPEGVAGAAMEIGLEIAERIGAVGVMAVELFVTPDRLLVNELALRPHNSGHYTIEGCVTSQFEQHLRAVLGLPLGDAKLLATSVVTANVVGGDGPEDPSTRLGAALEVPGAHVHLYGKQPRPGRKLGHVTVCGDDRVSTRSAALDAAGLLEGRLR